MNDKKIITVRTEAADPSEALYAADLAYERLINEGYKSKKVYIGHDEENKIWKTTRVYEKLTNALE